MNRVSIISVGNELLSGQCLDTNRAWLGERLYSVGLEVVSGYTVADEIEIVSDAITNAARQSKIILITGGLGPTDDDLTRQAVAKYLGVELEYHEELFEQIKAYFINRNYPMAEKNKVQAYIPQGAIALDNPVGTAPGFVCCRDELIIASMPGVPSEMKVMFENGVMPIIEKRIDGAVVLIKRLKCFGIGESALNEKLGDLMLRGQNPLVNCTVNQGVITLHIVARANNRDNAKRMIEQKETEIRDVAGEYVFGEADDGIEDALSREMIKAGKTVAVAESCTGGLISKMLTDRPGASDFFKCGWKTYTNEANQKCHGVSDDSLTNYGAVSEQVAREMAIGALKRSQADVAVAVTGIAGPSGGSEQKPVGLVYIAMAYDDKCVVKRCNFPPKRDVCRLRTAQTAMDFIRKEFLAMI